MRTEDLPDDDPAFAVRVLREDGKLEAGVEAPLADPRMLWAYREMRRLRLLDARMTSLQRQGRVSFYGGSFGQEAAPVATALAARPGDWVFPALREHGVMLARGYPLRSLVAQAFGNSADPFQGRQMPCHPSSRSVNQVSWSSCVGSQLPHAVGAAWAMRAARSEDVAIAFVGDGATSTGDFHAAMGFAGVWRVPCILVCQNNQWAISVPVGRQTAARTLALKGRAYGVRAVRVDGNDIMALYVVLKDALDRARAGGGPSFIEAVTYRVGAHSTSDDPSRYRPPGEEETWAPRDPLRRARGYLCGKGVLSEAGDAQLERELSAEIADAIDAVEPLAPAAPGSFFEDVYAEPPWHLREQLAQLKKI